MASGLLPAADHQNLEENLPVEVEDAYPIAYRGRELQFFTRYERLRGGGDRVVFAPRLEVGFARNWQGTISSELLAGSADRTGSGDIHVEVFRNLNMEGLRLPAFAVAAGVELPSGKDTAGVDPQLKFIVTKTLGRTNFLQRVHGNFIYTHNSARRSPDERADRYTAIAGYSVRLGPNAMLVADFVRRQEREKRRESNLFEGGVRMQLNPLTVLVAGVGAGVGADSPRFRATIGIQRALAR